MHLPEGSCCTARRADIAPAGERVSIPFGLETMFVRRECYFGPGRPMSRGRSSSLKYDESDKRVSSQPRRARLAGVVAGIAGRGRGVI